MLKTRTLLTKPYQQDPYKNTEVTLEWLTCIILLMTHIKLTSFIFSFFK